MRSISALRFGLASRVPATVLGDMAGGAGVAGRGIGIGGTDSVGEALERLTEALEDIWAFGIDRLDARKREYRAARLSSGTWSGLVTTRGAK